MQEFVVRAGQGLASGIGWSLLGWKKEPGREFDLFKFSRTLVIGALVGIMSEFTGLPHEGAFGFVQDAGGIVLVESALKAAFRNFVPESKLTNVMR